MGDKGFIGNVSEFIRSLYTSKSTVIHDIRLDGDPEVRYLSTVSPDGQAGYHNPVAFPIGHSARYVGKEWTGKDAVLFLDGRMMQDNIRFFVGDSCIVDRSSVQVYFGSLKDRIASIGKLYLSDGKGSLSHSVGRIKVSDPFPYDK
jgi:hypothetical protein